MEKIIITGCAGFIGSHLTETLLAAGYKVIGIDNFHPYYDIALKKQNLQSALQNSHFQFYEVDILKVSQLEKIFSENPSSTVVHLAALPGVRNSFEHPEEYFKINTEGTQSVFETALRQGIRHFLFSSSSSVYGEMQGQKAVEDVTPPNPISPYAKSKVEAEKVILHLAESQSFSVNILRFFTVYGPRQRPDMAFQKFRRKILAGETIELYGANISRDFTPVNRIVRGLEHALHYRNGVEIFNLGSGIKTPVKDIILQIGHELGLTPHIQIIPQQKGDPSFTLSDISKAKKLLNY